MRPLIDVSELESILPGVGLFDIRWALTDPDHGKSAYLRGHIPGAVFIDLDRDLSGPPGPGRHPLPDVSSFIATLGRAGVTTDDDMVVYDDAGGTIAARMWWMLQSLGHDRVRVLDGGYQAWVNSGLPVQTGDVIPASVDYIPLRPGFTGLVEIADLATRTLLDVRAPERYRGDIEPVDPKAGHIPGAVNLPSTGNLGPDGRFLDDVSLRARFEDLTGRIAVSCGSGVNACHTALAMKVAGLPLPEVYVGSFSEWSRLDLPVNTGDSP